MSGAKTCLALYLLAVVYTAAAEPSSNDCDSQMRTCLNEFSDLAMSAADSSSVCGNVQCYAMCLQKTSCERQTVEAVMNGIVASIHEQGVTCDDFFTRSDVTCKAPDLPQGPKTDCFMAKQSCNTKFVDVMMSSKSKVDVGTPFDVLCSYLKSFVDCLMTTPCEDAENREQTIRKEISGILQAIPEFAKCDLKILPHKNSKNGNSIPETKEVTTESMTTSKMEESSITGVTAQTGEEEVTPEPSSEPEPVGETTTLEDSDEDSDKDSMDDDKDDNDDNGENDDNDDNDDNVDKDDNDDNNDDDNDDKDNNDNEEKRETEVVEPQAGDLRDSSLASLTTSFSTAILSILLSLTLVRWF